MKLAEAEKSFGIPAETLERYESSGFISASGADGYEDENFKNLGLIHTFLSAGFSNQEIRKYMTLCGKPGADDEQIAIIRKRRYLLLDELHEKQRILDKLDFIVWNMKKEREKRNEI